MRHTLLIKLYALMLLCVLQSCGGSKDDFRLKKGQASYYFSFEKLESNKKTARMKAHMSSLVGDFSSSKTSRPFVGNSLEMRYTVDLPRDMSVQDIQNEITPVIESLKTFTKFKLRIEIGK